MKSWIKNKLGLNTPEENELQKLRAEIQKLSFEKNQIIDEIAKLNSDKVSYQNTYLSEIRNDIQKLENKKLNVMSEINIVNEEKERCKKELDEKRKDIIVVDEVLLLQDFGLYEPKYPFLQLETFKEKIKEIREQQKSAIKSAETAAKNTTWTVNNSKTLGRKMVSDITRLLIRAFNQECDDLIEHVKFNNFTSTEQRMKKSFDSINKYGGVLGIELTKKYLNLKLEELSLSYEYAIKKQEEKDFLAEKRAQERENQAAKREIEEMKKKVLKEEKHFVQAIEDNRLKFEATLDESLKKKLEDKIKELEFKLSKVQKDKEDVLNREQNTRAGYVYIISNIGSFGEDVYKIGVTRRLEPRDRVRELGDASVPFKFDIHALIFSEDAPALETQLHNTFSEYCLNKVNRRKEFFKVPLSKIEEVVKQHHAKEVEFEALAYADEYRQSLKML